MRKIHARIGNLVNIYLQEIANGNRTVQDKKVNKDVTVSLRDAKQFYYPHPISAIHEVNYFVQVRYCSSNIVTVGVGTKGGVLYCYINNDGYSSKTTKGYINAVLSALDLPYYIRIRNFAMELICTANGSDEIVPEFNGVKLLTKEL